MLASPAVWLAWKVGPPLALSKRHYLLPGLTCVRSCRLGDAHLTGEESGSQNFIAEELGGAADPRRQTSPLTPHRWPPPFRNE